MICNFKGHIYLFTTHISHNFLISNIKRYVVRLQYRNLPLELSENIFIYAFGFNIHIYVIISIIPNID